VTFNSSEWQRVFSYCPMRGVVMDGQGNLTISSSALAELRAYRGSRAGRPSRNTPPAGGLSCWRGLSPRRIEAISFNLRNEAEAWIGDRLICRSDERDLGPIVIKISRLQDVASTPLPNR
jgi:hypothetical protein